MPVPRCGVLAGRVKDYVAEADFDTPHFQIHIEAAGVSYRSAVNTRSAADAAPGNPDRRLL